MKWLSILLICLLAFLTNACEMHPASELEEDEHGEAHAEHKEGGKAGEKHEEKKAEEGKPGEAPKFFPETK